jgi:integrase/recombinase XerC
MFLRELENQVSETTSEKYNRNTLIRILSGIKSYYKYLKLKSIISDNPTKLVSSPKKNKYIPEFMFETEIEDLFNLPKVNTPLGLRDYLILECLYSTGARVSELVSLTVTMISNKDLIKILGKGNKERLIPIGERLKRAVYDFLPMRKLYLGKYNKADSDYLFFNSKGDKLTDRGVRYIINKYLMKSSLMKNISPHTFRHTFATHLLNNGADIRAVQELLGHSSLSTTQVYTHLTTDKLRRVYQQFHPRS